MLSSWPHARQALGPGGRGCHPSFIQQTFNGCLGGEVPSHWICSLKRDTPVHSMEDWTVGPRPARGGPLPAGAVGVCPAAPAPAGPSPSHACPGQPRAARHVHLCAHVLASDHSMVGGGGEASVQREVVFYTRGLYIWGSLYTKGCWYTGVGPSKPTSPRTGSQPRASVLGGLICTCARSNR